MAWKIEYWQKEHILSAEISGPIYLDTLKRIAFEIIVSLSINNVTRVLMDYRDATLEVSILDIFEMPNILKKLGYSPGIQIAVVYSDASEKKKVSCFMRMCCETLGSFTEFLPIYSSRWRGLKVMANILSPDKKEQRSSMAARRPDKRKDPKLQKACNGEKD